MVVLTDPEFYEAFTEVDRLRTEAQTIGQGELGAQLTREQAENRRHHRAKSTLASLSKYPSAKSRGRDREI